MTQNKELDILFCHHNKIAFTVKEVAQMLDVPLSAISKQIKDEKLEVVKIGRYYRVTKGALYDFLCKNLCLRPLI